MEWKIMTDGNGEVNHTVDIEIGSESRTID